MQRTHYNTTFLKKKFPIVLICDNVTHAPNIGSLFRTADAFGVEKMILCGQDITLGRKIKKTARATEKAVMHDINNSAYNVLQTLKEQNYQIIALEITNRSTAIHTFSFSKETPIALVIGDENYGISESILNSADHVLHIDMFGQNSSMNVVQATNIALYEITKQLRTEQK
ncbi:TrmH family RNA methyltransferase [Tamlana fucoidanivorans]|uniref:RNA methyltransferase n=1 Tax=Allotamlana fucoidanivorans TaxID=2583814 RepID=A0A5C4SSM9_9FLAO|nr:TrmH family RNA methyltransferase [Tamlana fucoidanivorans]TNJ46631.1 RNA methyltransferase [Tamlana fucoidanivorans]